ncbi:hypothetical protein RAS1_03390 [Phycisphaerae bacterium RAS1]|nr:hypothetical protein RAS1_03390 [Phycisphaerae bacterium RAS1]
MRLAIQFAMLTAISGVPSVLAQTAVIRWYLSTDGLQDPAGDPNDPVNAANPPANFPFEENPTVDATGGARLYLWASNAVPRRVWNGFQDYAFVMQNGDAVINSVMIYNHRMTEAHTPDDPDDDERWAGVSSGSPQSPTVWNGVTMFYVSGRSGVRDWLPEEMAWDTHYQFASGRSTLIGHIDVQGTRGELFFRSGLSSAINMDTGGGIMAGNTRIYLGFGDDDGPIILGGSAAIMSATPEAIIEPAPVCTCDANCDGNVDILDINAFVLAIGGQAAWQAQYPCEFFCANDVNDDGAVNVLDINAFVVCVFGL